MRSANAMIFLVAAVAAATYTVAGPFRATERQRSCEDGLKAFDFFCRGRYVDNALKYQDCVIYRMAMIDHKFRDSYRLLGPKSFYCVGNPQSCSEGARLTIETCSAHQLNRGGSTYRRCLRRVMGDYGFKSGRHYRVAKGKLICDGSQENGAQN